MNPFENLTTEGLEENTDRGAGGGRTLLDTDAYKLEIQMAYVGKASDPTSKSMSVTLLTKIVDGPKAGTEYRETFWITNKKGENFYLTKDNKKAQLGGFADINELCQITTGKELRELGTEEGLVKIWNKDQRKELPESRQIIPALKGKVVGAAIQKKLENKQTQGPNGYVDTAESREVNNVQKFYHPELRITVNEAKRKAKGEELGDLYIDAWIKNNQGQVYDARKIKDGGNAGNAGAPTPGAPANTASNSAPSLFG